MRRGVETAVRRHAAKFDRHKASEDLMTGMTGYGFGIAGVVVAHIGPEREGGARLIRNGAGLRLVEVSHLVQPRRSARVRACGADLEHVGKTPELGRSYTGLPLAWNRKLRAVPFSVHLVCYPVCLPRLLPRLSRLARPRLRQLT